MIKPVTLMMALAMLSPAAAQAATDPALACGKKKVKIVAKYSKCLDKALLAFPLDTRPDKIAKCHEKCTEKFVKAEEKYVECAQEGLVADYCGPASDTFAYADCRQDFFLFGSSGCYP